MVTESAVADRRGGGGGGVLGVPRCRPFNIGPKADPPFAWGHNTLGIKSFAPPSKFSIRPTLDHKIKEYFSLLQNVGVGLLGIVFFPCATVRDAHRTKESD